LGKYTKNLEDCVPKAALSYCRKNLTTAKDFIQEDEKTLVNEGQIVISIMAGVTIKIYARWSREIS